MNNDINPYAAPHAEVRDHGETTAEPRILTASGRVNRLRYLAYTMGMSILVLVLAGVLSVFAAMISPVLSAVVIGVAYLGLFVVQIMLTIQRCHDFNTTGWLSLLIFVPLGIFIFWLVPGTAGENRYAPPNPPNTAIHYLGALVLPLVAVIGILAAIAIPAYSDYAKRAKAAQAQQVKPPPAPQLEQRPAASQ